MGKPVILLVDDEPIVLNMLESLLKRVGDFLIIKASGGRQALDILAKQQVSLIVSDINMPEMQGTELLDQVSKLYPSTVRLFFSGELNEEVALKSVTSAHQYFSKPSDARAVIKAIQKAFLLQELLPNDGLRKIISDIKQLPSMPDVYLEVERELRSGDCSVLKIGEIIGKDVAMSAKVLHLVNSAFFGLREHVSSPAQAATLLGINTLKSLVLMVHVFSEWENSDIQCFSLSELWMHSLGVANGAKAIVSTVDINADDKEDIFIAGLFHDIGKLVQVANMPEAFQNIITLVQEKHIPFHVAEKEIIGATHAQIGAYLLGLWGFSDSVVKASAFHHELAHSGELGLSSVLAVHIANVVNHEGRTTTESIPYEGLDTVFIEQQGLSERMDEWRELCLREC